MKKFTQKILESNDMDDDIMKEIRYLEVDCPECKYTSDDQYTLCGCGGSDGKINVYEYLKSL